MNRIDKEFEERRNKILKAAKKMFIKYGFDNVSLSQIAKEAEFGKSTLYHYFASKNELLYVVIRTHDLKRLASCQDEFRNGCNSFDKIYRYLWEYYQYVKKDYTLFMLTYRNDSLLYRKIIPNLSEKLRIRYEESFTLDAQNLKQVLIEGGEDNYFTTITDKNYQLGYIMSTTRGLINFIFQIAFVSKSMSEEQADEYFKLHLNLILRNL